MLVVTVADGDKVGQELAICGINREVTLVFTHDRHQHFGGQGQIFLFEAADEGGGFLDQIGHFVEQAGIGRNGPVEAVSQRGRVPLNNRLPFGHPHHEAIVVQSVQVRGRVLNHNLRRIIRAQPTTDAAADHSGIGERNHIRAVQGHQPAQRAAEADVAPVPAHALGEFQAGDPLGQRSGQHLRRRTPRLEQFGGHITPFAIVHHIQIFDVDPFAPGKPFGGFGGVAIKIEGPVSGWPLHFHLQVGLAALHVVDDDRQAARRTVNL